MTENETVIIFKANKLIAELLASLPSNFTFISITLTACENLLLQGYTMPPGDPVITDPNI